MAPPRTAVFSETRAAYDAAYFQANREAIYAKRKARPKRPLSEAQRAADAERSRAWHLQNRERQREYRRAYYQANRDKIRQQSRACALANPERTSAQLKAWREANRERYQRSHGAADRRRRARLRGVEYEVFDHFEIFDRDGWVCAICGEGVDPQLAWPDPRSVSLDHIIPISKMGGHLRSNVQTAHLDCNQSKFNRVPHG